MATYTHVSNSIVISLSGEGKRKRFAFFNRKKQENREVFIFRKKSFLNYLMKLFRQSYNMVFYQKVIHKIYKSSGKFWPQIHLKVS